MKRRFMLPLAAAAAMVVPAVFAAPASAMPTQGSACTGCHSPASSVQVSATQASNNGTTATYNVAVATASGRDGWAVFKGATKVAYGTSATGQFSVAVGSTYTVYGVIGGNNSNSVSISPIAPPTPPTPTPVPTPTPTPVPTPTPTPVPTPTPSPVPTPTPSPVPTPTPSPVPTPTPAPTTPPTVGRLFTVKVRVSAEDGTTVVLKNASTGAEFLGSVHDGRIVIANVPAGSYQLVVGGFDTGKVVRVGMPRMHHRHHHAERHAERD